MLVVMQHNAPPEQIAAVCEAIRQMGLTPHPMAGPTRTAIGITGNTQAIDAPRLEVQPGVMELIRVTKPYKLASREMHPDDTHVELAQTTVGSGSFTIIAGPCSCEDESTMLRIASQLADRGVKLLRAAPSNLEPVPTVSRAWSTPGSKSWLRYARKPGWES